MTRVRLWPAPSRAPSGWQLSLGDELAGKTLGLLGLGHVGSAVGIIGRPFRMNVIAWSQNLPTKRAAEKGVQLVRKDVLFSTQISCRFTCGLASEPRVWSARRNSRRRNLQAGDQYVWKAWLKSR
ncbi:NAD(P)-dependent oxidoreductase [Caballeronia udeis]|uniref:NAD(P)-dependent oxidoreductase n=1 Tax=Caballeronia udeis TaxID=1232866 RepID=UPI002F91753C